MKNYERPVMIRTEELAEGVYLASGGIKCDSVYRRRIIPTGMAPHADTSSSSDVLDARRILLPAAVC